MREETNKTYLYYFGLISVIILGIWFRFKGLGKWPLAVDEYYIVKSIESILEYGIPKFEAGGYYERGLLYQYLTAFLIYIGVKVEFAARLIPVISNLVTIPPLFLIAKKISGKTLSFIVIAVFSLSLWEIEMARFARMYAPFQAIYIWYLYFLFTVIIENKKENRKWMYLLNIISLFIYEGAILITLLNFLPFFWNKRIELKHLLISALILLTNYFYIKTDLRMIGSENTLPQIAIDFMSTLPSGGGIIKSPVLFFNTIGDPFWILTLSVISIIHLYFLFKIIRNSKFDYLEKLSLIIISLFAFLHQFGLTILLLIAFTALNWIKIKRQLFSYFSITLVFIVVYFAYWFNYCLFNDSWYYLSENFVADSFVAVIKRSLVVLFNYPGNYSTFWVFFETIPILTFLTFGFTFISAFISLLIRENKYINLILVISIASLLFTNLVTTPYETRYFFFLYPLIIIITLFAIDKLVNYLKTSDLIKYFLISILLFSFLSISEDFNFFHLKNIDSKEVNFRMNYDEMLERHYYRRYDVQTPAEYVNKYAQNNDIILTNEMVLEYYLEKLDYIFLDYRSRRFWILSTNEGTKERWTNSNLIFETNKLDKFLTQNDKDIWFVVHKLEYIQQPMLEIDFYNRFEQYLVYRSLDDMVEVYKIPVSKK